MLAGKQLANAAVSLRVSSGSSSSSSQAKPGSRQTRSDAISTQRALDLLDANEAQAGKGAF